MKLEDIIDLKRYPITDEAFKEQSRQTVAEQGVFAMPGFLTDAALTAIREEGEQKQSQAFFSHQFHNVYLTDKNPEYADDHAFNRQVVSSKGCITDDQIGENSALRTLYNAQSLKDFLSYVFVEEALYPYADPLSSINLHYAKTGQELGWHFDNSSFAITLMIQPTEKGGQFEYIKDVRDADAGEMNFDAIDKVLDGDVSTSQLSMDAGALVLFRGRNAIHRVTPNEGDRTRMLVVLAYNSQPNIALSESARMTFYGRLGE